MHVTFLPEAHRYLLSTHMPALRGKKCTVVWRVRLVVSRARCCSLSEKLALTWAWRAGAQGADGHGGTLSVYIMLPVCCDLHFWSVDMGGGARGDQARFARARSLCGRRPLCLSRRGLCMFAGLASLFLLARPCVCTEGGGGFVYV